MVATLIWHMAALNKLTKYNMDPSFNNARTHAPPRFGTAAAAACALPCFYSNDQLHYRIVFLCSGG